MFELIKGEVLYQGNGYRLWATGDEALAIMEWDRPEACRLADALAALLRRHALSTSLEECLGAQSLVVKRLAMLPVTALVQSDGEELRLAFLDEAGQEVEREMVKHLPHVGPHRLDGMEDTALHALRSLRAYLSHGAPPGQGANPGQTAGLRLRLVFGQSADGALILQVPNPLDCDFGTNDYTALAEQLGGQAK